MSNIRGHRRKGRRRNKIEGSFLLNTPGDAVEADMAAKFRRHLDNAHEHGGDRRTLTMWN